MGINDRPLLTDTYLQIDDFIPEEGSAYLSAVSFEQRSDHTGAWEPHSKNVQFIRITDQNFSNFGTKIGDKEGRVLLRSGEQLKGFLASVTQNILYVDITGLAHHVWAPILRAALQANKIVRVVYVEPSDYRFSKNPMEGDIFDLSVKIKGIGPIPGFASLNDVDEERTCFIPLLGFEGARFAYLVAEVNPIDEKVLPIIGVPGFLPQYPFYTYHGNQLPLTHAHEWRNVRYAIANCPFSLFYTLEDIAEEYPQDLLKIAPIGTKPHALGAILYSLARPQQVELVYDHPIRKEERTEGAARLLVYHVSALPMFNIT